MNWALGSRDAAGEAAVMILSVRRGRSINAYPPMEIPEQLKIITVVSPGSLRLKDVELSRLAGIRRRTEKRSQESSSVRRFVTRYVLRRTLSDNLAATTPTFFVLPAIALRSENNTILRHEKKTIHP